MSETTVMKRGRRTRANDDQVGGNHYKTDGIEYWDLFGPEALMFYAGRYVARWRKKNGVEDLRKAEHVVRKLVEVIGSRQRIDFADPFNYVAAIETFEAWARNAGLDWVEKTIISNIMYWQTRQNLKLALEGIEHMIATTPVESDEMMKLPTGGSGGPVGPVAAISGDEFIIKDTERRVPRYTYDHGHRWKDNQLWPWQMSKDEYTSVFTGRMQWADHFYRKAGTDNLILEPSVWEGLSSNLPRELQNCYRLTDHHWIIAIERVPSELRANYPYLSHDRNETEYLEIAFWQRLLYVYDTNLGKYVLKNMAWTKPEDAE